VLCDQIGVGGVENAVRCEEMGVAENSERQHGQKRQGCSASDGPLKSAWKAHPGGVL
jgi:hypothetical protein